MNPDCESSQSPPVYVPLAAAGGIRWPTRVAADPFAELDDLMLLVEALCPEWPPRGPFGPMPNLRL